MATIPNDENLMAGLASPPPGGRCQPQQDAWQPAELLHNFGPQGRQTRVELEPNAPELARSGMALLI